MKTIAPLFFLRSLRLLRLLRLLRYFPRHSWDAQAERRIVLATRCTFIFGPK